MKKILLSLLISLSISNVYAMNANTVGNEMNVPGVASNPQTYTPNTPPYTPAYTSPVPADIETTPAYTEDYTPPYTPQPVVPVRQPSVTNQNMSNPPIYENDPIPVVTDTIPDTNVNLDANKSREELFEDCILKSDQMMEVLDTLKNIPEKERISTLYESGYWSTLNERDKDRTLKTLANLTGLDKSQYTIIKGKMADSFKNRMLKFN